jgi:D-serine deaminase-like pyridoxal phosphate-dependent protein
MPTLLLDRQKCLRNMEKMASKAASQTLSLRPHCKTHQSAEIGSWLRDFGVSGITVSSFQMARYFADAGWRDILVAFPFYPGETENLEWLSEKCHLSILVDSPASLPFLHHIPERIGIYIDIDTGYGRTGVKPENPELIEQIILKARANPQLEFRGFYCHAGHSYKAGSREELNQIHRKAIDDLDQLKKDYKSLAPVLLYGDTPNCSIQEEFGTIDEITPGNFIFYDLIQFALGACSMEEIAVAVKCPVAGRYPSDERIVVHGGAVHFSKETMLLEETTIYGKLVQPAGKSWEEHVERRFLTSLSQEHGVMEHCGELVREVNIGDPLLFLPVHSCLTANLAREYVTTEGRRVTNIHSAL